MRTLWHCGVIFLMLFAAPAGAAEKTLYLPTGEAVASPSGWRWFCMRHSSDCEPTPLPVRVSRKAVWQTLLRVNQSVNAHIKPMTDLEHYGVVEWWAYPTDGYGDCEDHVLLKRKMLIREGLPQGNLPITIVLNKGEGHAVLIVRTDEGDFVLDSLTSEVKLWSRTGYQFRSLQSADNPNIWIAVEGGQPVAVAKQK